MSLADLISLPIGAGFSHKGSPATILKQHYFEHVVAYLKDENKELIYKAWVVVFECNGQKITLTSQYPNPKNLQLIDFS
jgi:hypothetical protein